MTFEEYKNIIDKWDTIAIKAGVKLSSGKPLPLTFWKTFLGLKRRVHQDMYNGTYNIKTSTSTKMVPEYIARSINFAAQLSEEVFVRMVKADIGRFEQDKIS
jgi:hypothetical protein